MKTKKFRRQDGDDQIGGGGPYEFEGKNISTAKGLGSWREGTDRETPNQSIRYNPIQRHGMGRFVGGLEGAGGKEGSSEG